MPKWVEFYSPKWLHTCTMALVIKNYTDNAEVKCDFYRDTIMFDFYLAGNATYGI